MRKWLGVKCRTENEERAEFVYIPHRRQENRVRREDTRRGSGGKSRVGRKVESKLPSRKPELSETDNFWKVSAS